MERTVVEKGEQSMQKVCVLVEHKTHFGGSPLISFLSKRRLFESNNL